MAYHLYKKRYENAPSGSDGVCEFTPSPRGWFIPGKGRTKKTALVRFYFWLISLGRAKIFYLKSEDGKPVHTSCVLPNCYKFPFMKKGEYEIGPCFTAETTRGKGYYGIVLNHITHNRQFENACFYMLVEESNAPSIRGIKKARFVLDGYAKKQRC